MGGTHLDHREIHQIGKRTREFLIHPEYCPALLRYHIRLAGISLATTGFRFERHRPEATQLLMCFRGQGMVWVDGQWKSCDSGMAYLTPPGCHHAYRSGKKWEVGWVSYSGTGAFSIKAPLLLKADPRPLEYVLKGLHQEVSAQREAVPSDYWVELLHYQVARIVEPLRPSRLWQLWEKVQADLGHAWDLSRLAKLACVGPENLRRICLRETGQSPMQYVKHLRMRHAVSLLSRGNKVETVAHAVGYENAFAFASAFKRIMHRTPSEFRS